MIRFFLNLYIFIIIIDAVISYMPSNIKFHPYALKLKQLVDFTLAPIRKVLPPDLPIDISPLIAIILIRLLIAIW